jgi:rRNA-processing protein FCF1
MAQNVASDNRPPPNGRAIHIPGMAHAYAGRAWRPNPSHPAECSASHYLIPPPPIIIMACEVLLDTNALLLPHQHRVDVFAEIARILSEPHELVTMSGVLEELGRLAGPGSKDGVAAKVALALVAERGLRVIPSEGHVDRAIIEYACENKAYVCTNDGELRSKLRRNGVRVLSMRGKTHMGLD